MSPQTRVRWVGISEEAWGRKDAVDVGGRCQRQAHIRTHSDRSANSFVVRIGTDRLVLRPLVPNDRDAYVALHSHKEVTRFVGQVDTAEADRRLLAFARQWAVRGHGMFAVLERDALPVVGVVGLDYWPQWDETELGWLLSRDVWGRGYATEAASACADWAFANLTVPYVTSMIHPENRRSLAVAHRLEMSLLRRDRLGDQPVLVFGLRRDRSGFDLT